MSNSCALGEAFDRSEPTGARSDLDRRLARLHVFMHEAHEVGHDDRDYGYGGHSGGYGDQNHSRERNRRDDHDDDD